MAQLQPAYPSREHALAAEAAVQFFAADPDVAAVLLTGSCARGRASRASCVDLLALVRPDVPATRREALEQRWQRAYETEEVYRDLERVGKFAHVDLDIGDGCFAPRPRGWTSGPDAFELEIGNALVYTVPLWTRGPYLASLQARWLPYYDDALRAERLGMVRRYCRNNLDHIPLFVERGLYFQSFHRLYDAFREFLQVLFIARRTYPIAYDKWIREQVEEILGLPELYRQLPPLFEIARFESAELAQKAEQLGRLLDTYVVE